MEFNDFRIEIFDDTAYVGNSNDSPTKYDLVYIFNEDYLYGTQHGIKVFKNEQFYKSAILLGNAGGTGIQSDSALIDDDNLIIRCSNQLYSLTLPDLNKNWNTEADWATCFSVYKYEDSYITHGEMTISRINKAGQILWSFSGGDIFVTPNEGIAFKMHEKYIELTDFSGSKYKIDYAGNSLDYIESDYHNQKPVIVNLDQKKHWWKFW